MQIEQPNYHTTMTVKFLATAAAMLAFSTIALCQDVITKTDGSSLQVKVTDIEDAVIKYKKFDNQEGPTYSINKKDVVTIAYKNGSVDKFSEEEAKPAASGSTSGKLDLDDENTIRQIEALAKNAGESVLSKCTGKVDNARTEIFYDGVYKDDFTHELVIPIQVTWQPRNISGDSKWIRGTVKVASDGKKTWVYQNDSGGWFGGCARKLHDL